MKQKRSTKCTARAVGTIHSLGKRGMDFPTTVVVSYMVAGRQFEISETLKLKSQAIRLGFLPVGQRKSPVLRTIDGQLPGVGGQVSVSYDPADPQNAFLTDNSGRINI